MPYSIEMLADEPIIMIVLGPDFGVHEMQPSILEGLKLFEAQTESFYLVIEIPAAFKANMEQLSEMTDTLARGDAPVYHFPLLKKILWVTKDEIWRMAGRGMASDVYGNAEIEMFDTVAEALAYARANI